MSTVAIMFSYISNRSLVEFMEYSDFFCGEQNGLIKLNFVLIVYSFCVILRNGKSMQFGTFTFIACFVDFCKAFDSVNHSVVWSIMTVAGII